MFRRIAHAVPGGLALAAALLLLGARTAGAQVAEFWLRAEKINLAVPGGRVVPMWGYALTDATFVPGVATVPGPALTVPVGATGLTIHLKNQDIPEGISVVIPGQEAPTDGVNPPQVVRNPDGRARSFTHETALGATADYVWWSIRPGTYLYQSGSHPAVQVQMGLYGALEFDAAGGNAYGAGASAYDQDLVLVYSEIDPALHDAVAAGQFGPGLAVTSTLEYHPAFFLVNGSPYAPGRSPMPLGAPGKKTLLRFLNAGLETHLPVLGGGSELTLLAEDGNLAPFARQATQVELPPGKTVDATVVVPAPGYYPLYDRKLSLVNDRDPEGGMLAFLSVPAPSTATLTVVKAGTGTGRVAIASAPGGLNCGVDCTEVFNLGTPVTLRAYPNPGSLLTGWSGGGATCAGLGDCVTTLGLNKTVTATFTSYPGVKVGTPNGGESVNERSLHTIRWAAPASATSFTLYFTANGGTSWNLIDHGLAGNSYVWTVPNVPATRTNCRVRVRGYTAAGALVGSDISDAVFSIVNLP